MLPGYCTVTCEGRKMVVDNSKHQPKRHEPNRSTSRWAVVSSLMKNGRMKQISGRDFELQTHQQLWKKLGRRRAVEVPRKLINPGSTRRSRVERHLPPREAPLAVFHPALRDMEREQGALANFWECTFKRSLDRRTSRDPRSAPGWGVTNRQTSLGRDPSDAAGDNCCKSLRGHRS